MEKILRRDRTFQVNEDVQITLYYPQNLESYLIIGDTEGNEHGRLYGEDAEKLYFDIIDLSEDDALTLLAEYV